MSNQCLNKALQLLTRRDHSCDELRKKLHVRGFQKQEIRDAIDKCLHLGYLDDQRFADIYLERLHGKGYGINLIKSKMYAKGVPKEVVRTRVESYCTDQVELTACKKVLAKKIKTNPKARTIDSERPKLQRFLIGRGFSNHIIAQAMEEIVSNSE